MSSQLISIRGIDVRPSLFCPSVDVTAPLIDVGFGMPHELEPLLSKLEGAVVLIAGAADAVVCACAVVDCVSRHYLVAYCEKRLYAVHGRGRG